MPKFDDPRLSALEAEPRFHDAGMRRALSQALEPGETALAGYSVSAHIWVEAVLTDRALLIVKGAVRARTLRVPFPLEIVREPRGTKQGARLSTPLGRKTLWGSRLDPDMALLRSCTAPAPEQPSTTLERRTPPDGQTSASQADAAPSDVVEASERTVSRPEGRAKRPSRRERAEARRRAGKKPKKPRRRRARPTWVGFAPSSTIWDISYNCVKCGRPLTNPDSQRHRVGTDCIKRYGSQARKIPNPAHAEWTARKAKADADRIAQQVSYDAEYARAQAAYAADLARWRLIRSGLDLVQGAQPEATGSPLDRHEAT